MFHKNSCLFLLEMLEAIKSKPEEAFVRNIFCISRLIHRWYDKYWFVLSASQKSHLRHHEALSRTMKTLLITAAILRGAFMKLVLIFPRGVWSPCQERLKLMFSYVWGCEGDLTWLTVFYVKLFVHFWHKSLLVVVLNRFARSSTRPGRGNSSRKDTRRCPRSARRRYLK